MRQYILDTDCVSLILYNHPKIVENVAKHQVDQVAITIITVQELFNGWITRINDPSQLQNLPSMYTKFWTTVTYIQAIKVLNFTAEADFCLKKLLKDNPTLRKNRLQKGMRIAAIAISIEAIVVTRNQRDFAQVPNLMIEDWTL